MPSTAFTDNATVIYSAWLNDINNAVYNGVFPNGSVHATADTATLATNCTNAIGYSQTWQNMSGSRAYNTPYTNTSGKPIEVNVLLTATTGSTNAILTVGGIPVTGSQAPGQSPCYPSVTAIVPAGAIYSITVNSGTATINYWSELR